MVLLLLKLVAAVLGLTLPGYALARALRIGQCLATAFPFSAFLLCQTVMLQQILTGRVSVAVVGTGLCALTLLFSLIAWRGTAAAVPCEAPAEMESTPSPLLFRAGAFAAGALLLAAAFRTTIYPLGGFDTFIRWDALAREMLRYGSLSFYPPLSGADFSIYTMPDGFPPLIASVYWWIYAATGTALPQLTTLSVMLQLASILGLTWSAAETAFGRKAASLSLLALSAAPLLLRSVQIGQESGFLALAIAGQICFALAARRRPALTTITAAALLASLAPLSREYGPALILPGFFILIFEPATRRLAWHYVLLAALLSSPWYLRNWLLTGTPLYPLALPGSPPANPLLADLMHYYGGIFGIANFGAGEWLAIGRELLLGGSVALLAGLFALALHGRRLMPYTLSLLLVVSLWLWSIGKTSGGVIYSMRVLAPAIVILSLVTGKALADLADRGRIRQLALLLAAAVLWSGLCTLSFPLQPAQIGEALLSTKGEAPDFITANREFVQEIGRLGLPASGLLTDSPYLAVLLQRETRFRPVIIWSSEVSSVLSPRQSAAETEKQLLGKGITLVALSRSSIHNDLLFSIPFYRDGVTGWKQLTAVGDWALFAIETEAGR